MSEFADLLAAARKRRKHSQLRAAATVGVSQPRWSRYEAGEALPHTDKMPQFAEYLEISEDDAWALVESAGAERASRPAVEIDVIQQLRADVDVLQVRVDELGKLDSAQTRLQGAVETLTQLFGATLPPSPRRRAPASPKR